MPVLNLAQALSAPSHAVGGGGKNAIGNFVDLPAGLPQALAAGGQAPAAVRRPARVPARIPAPAPAPSALAAAPRGKAVALDPAPIAFAPSGGKNALFADFPGQSQFGLDPGDRGSSGGGKFGPATGGTTVSMGDESSTEAASRIGQAALSGMQRGGRKGAIAAAKEAVAATSRATKAAIVARGREDPSSIEGQILAQERSLVEQAMKELDNQSVARALARSSKSALSPGPLAFDLDNQSNREPGQRAALASLVAFNAKSGDFGTGVASVDGQNDAFDNFGGLLSIDMGTALALALARGRAGPGSSAGGGGGGPGTGFGTGFGIGGAGPGVGPAV